MKIHELQVSGKKPRKRVGRGDGSGSGTTAGRGHNGQNSRSGGKVAAGFEGGQTPLSKRLPKTRGFKKASRQWSLLHTDQLERFPANTRVDKLSLKQYGINKYNSRPIKLLYRGEIEVPLQVYVNKASRQAREAVERAGGTVTTPGRQE